MKNETNICEKCSTVSTGSVVPKNTHWVCEGCKVNMRIKTITTTKQELRTITYADAIELRNNDQ